MAVPPSFALDYKVGDKAKDMGEYFPRGRHISTTAFEIAAPCLIQ